MTVFVTIPLPDGKPVQLPLEQAETLASLCKQHPGSTWHFNDCGCCICLHPGGDKSQGFIINFDGDAELHGSHN